MDNFDDLYFQEYRSKGVKSISDTRKPKLTLKHLNRLKKIQAVRKLDYIKRQSLLSIMYGVPSDNSGGL